MPGASRIQARARDLAQRVRDARGDRLGVEAFLHEYGLSTPEGVMLMCLAEALLRIPDPETADRLIRDKLGAGDWAGHLGRSGSLLVNASTWGLMLTGRFVRVDLDEQGGRRRASRGSCIAWASRWCAPPRCRRCACWASTSCSARPSSRRSPGRDEAERPRLPLLVRHAGRGGAHHGGRRALSRGLRPRHRRDRRGRRAATR